MIEESKEHKIREVEQEKTILEEMNKLQESRNINHAKRIESFNQETRTPLVAIKAYTDMLLEGKYGDLNDMQRQKLTIVKKNIKFLVDAIFEIVIKDESNRV